MTSPRRLIEVDLPIRAISAHARHKNFIKRFTIDSTEILKNSSEQVLKSGAENMKSQETSTARPDCDEGQDRYAQDFEFAQNRIRHEDTLIDNRLNWLLTSQTIFVAAYTISPPSALSSIQDLIPYAAVLIWLSSYISLLGALAAIYRYCAWLKDRHREQSARSENFILGQRSTHVMGQQAVFLSPLIFLWIWLTVLTKDIFLPIAPIVATLLLAIGIIIVWSQIYPFREHRKTKRGKPAAAHSK